MYCHELNLSDGLTSVELCAGSWSDKDLQRAEGSGRIVVSGSESGTRIMDVFQQSPIHIMFPRTASGPEEEAVLINTAGGVCSGGRPYDAATTLCPGSRPTTTQASQ